MAFKINRARKRDYEDIESLFTDLSGKKIQNLYAHQADILRSYEKEAINIPDVALELPTGSGKTLVGMLIAEYRRIKFDEKVLYLCPTKQLVNQVVSYTKEKYRIDTIGFSGSKNDYHPTDVSKFNGAEAVGVTNYSSLFNSNPFFQPDLIILDDAHAAENYIASNWSLSISRAHNSELYFDLVEILEPHLPNEVNSRLKEEVPDPITERRFIEILPFVIFQKCKERILDLLSSIGIENKNIYFRWLMIKGHMEACNVFISWDEILIRPLIPPSLSHDSFREANQRVYMSATLGKGGDLERITGIPKIHKVPTPKGWDISGLGRRFFIIPDQGFDRDDTYRLTHELLSKTKKTVVILGSDTEAEDWELELSEQFPEKEIFDARSIENSKKEFIDSEDAVILLSNRFDGIDFQDDEARLLILSEIQTHGNLQERFIQSRTSASIIFNDRNKTRLIQAIGRCTRNTNDYAAILILGNKGLAEWISTNDKRKLLHQELQSEISFGIEQSRETSINELLDSYDHFLRQTSDWHDANKSIKGNRETFLQNEVDGENQLSTSVLHEVNYQYALWNEDYEKAYDHATKVSNCIEGNSTLKGYRALWYYMTAKAAWFQWSASNNGVFKNKADHFLSKTLSNTKSLTLIRKAHQNNVDSSIDDQFVNEVDINVENLDIYFEDFGLSKAKKAKVKLDETKSRLYSNDGDKLELGHKEIGSLIGFDSYKSGDNGAPDPYWKSGDDLVFVFEDKVYDTESKCIPLKDVRQAISHETWIRSNVSISRNCKIVTVFLTNSSCIEDEAKIHCTKLLYWNLDEFRKLGGKVIEMINEIQNRYPGKGDSDFREFLKKKLIQYKLTPSDILTELRPMEEIF